jgi:hypothetical protein
MGNPVSKARTSKTQPSPRRFEKLRYVQAKLLEGPTFGLPQTSTHIALCMPRWRIMSLRGHTDRFCRRCSLEPSVLQFQCSKIWTDVRKTVRNRTFSVPPTNERCVSPLRSSSSSSSCINLHMSPPRHGSLALRLVQLYNYCQ